MSWVILDAIRAQAARRSDAIALRDGVETVGYGDLARALDRAAAAPRSGVCVITEPRPLRAVVAALAARAAGAVPLVLAPGQPAPPLDVELPAGTAFLRATGGTTARPRLVAFDEAGAHATAWTYGELLALEAGSALALTVPPSAGYGWNAWIGPLVRGATVWHVPATAPRAFLDALRDPGVAWGGTTPPVVRALARLDGAGGRATRVIVGAATYPAAEAAEAQRRHGVAVFDRYGATEAGPLAQSDEPGGPLRAAGGVTLRLAGEPPTIEVSGPQVALGYVGGPGFGGVFRTADGADFDGDGRFRLRGRTDRVVRRLARPVDLAAVEDAIAALPGVARCRVRVEPGALDVELVAQVVPGPGPAPAPAELHAALAARLDPWERPTRIEVVAAELAPDVEKWRAS
jgi:acyl-coenzyme A synthetase/AMP-(fatty) acid ligase